MKAILKEYDFGSLHIWDKPLENRKYVLGMDTAEGRERDLGQMRKVGGRDDRPDYSAGIVIDMETGQHVASWRGQIPPIEWGYAGAAIGYFYNEALIVPEINGPGIAVVEALADHVQYPNLYINRTFGNIGAEEGVHKWGWRTTVQTRPLLIARIEEALTSDAVFTRDHMLIRELRTMEIDERGIARARHPNHDDMVIAFGLALQGRQEYLYGVQSDNPVDEYADLPAWERRVWRIRKMEKDLERERSNLPGYRRTYHHGRVLGHGGLG